MMKKILVPVDFSEYSKFALEVAASLARKYHAEILVLHMLGLSAPATLTKVESQEKAEAFFYLSLAKKRFGEFLDEDYLKGLKVSEMVQNYKVFRELNNVAKENNADLIVMGSHGSSGIREVFIGSNTEKVVRTSDVPVLIIKERIKDFKIDKALFACDFSKENIPAYLNAMNFLSQFTSDINLLYVNLPGALFKSSLEMRKIVKQFFLEAGPLSTKNIEKVHYYNDYSVEDGIFNFSYSEDIDVITMPTHGRRGLAHFFTGSLAETIANHTYKPMITFKI